MKEVYSHEFNTWQRVMQRFLGMWRINKDSIDFKWGYFAPRFGFELMLNRGGYFDSQYSVDICIIFGHFNIKLPFKTSLKEGCDLPNYGISIHNNVLWIHYGGKYDESWGQVTGDSYWTWYLPFFHIEHKQHSILSNDGEWVSMNNHDIYEFRLSEALLIETSFIDGCDEKEISASYSQEKRLFHRKWFPFLTKSYYYIDINFDQEVGPEKGSWKGGTLGIQGNIENGETPSQAFHRIVSKYM